MAPETLPTTHRIPRLTSSKYTSHDILLEKSYFYTSWEPLLVAPKSKKIKICKFDTMPVRSHLNCPHNIKLALKFASLLTCQFIGYKVNTIYLSWGPSLVAPKKYNVSKCIEIQHKQTGANSNKKLLTVTFLCTYQNS